MQGIPDKEFYKVAEVCQYTDTQPYVLRFWESEFPQLSPSKGRSGQSVYRREDIDLVLRIKQLLYDQEYSIADARETLDREASAGRKAGKQSKQSKQKPRAAAKKTPAAKPEPAEPAPAPPAQPSASTSSNGGSSARSVSRERYEDAVEEINHLRLKLKDAEARCRKAEQDADDVRDRADRAAERLSRLVNKLRES